MRRLTLLGAALIAVLALGAFAASAFASPEMLPGGAWTGLSDGSGKPTWETAKKETIVCEKEKGEGTQTTDSEGAFHLTIEGCEFPSLKVKCNSLGDAAGILLTLGTYKYVWDSLSPLGVAILFLPEELHVECTALALLKFKSASANGGYLCLILEPESSKVTHLFHCEQKEGVQTEKTYWNASGTEEKAELLGSKNEGAAEPIGLLLLFSLTYKEASKFMTV